MRRLAVPARAPHCLLCVLSSGGGGGSGGRGGEQGSNPGPVAPALWPPRRRRRLPWLLRAKAAGSLPHLRGGLGGRVPAPSGERAWAV